jgi:acyl transferase domain-containing protein
VLLGMGRRCLPQDEAGLTWLPSLREDQDWEPLLDSLGRCIHTGVRQWTGAAFERDYLSAGATKGAALPTYPFQRQRYWIENRGPQRPVSAPPAQAALHPFLDQEVSLAFASDTRIWQGEVSLARFPYLADHQVQGVPVVPATAYLEMVLAAAALAFGPGPLVIADVDNRKVLVLGPDDSHTVQVVLSKIAGEQAAFAVFSRPQRLGDGPAGPWREHVVGTVRRGQQAAQTPFGRDEVLQRCAPALDGAEFYALQAQKGNGWGAAFQGIQQLWRGQNEALSLVRPAPSIAQRMSGYWLHPALSDSSGHVLVGTLPLREEEGAKQGAFVGGGIQELRFYRRPVGDLLWSYARLRTEDDQPANVLCGDVAAYDETGALVAETIGARLWYLDKESQAAWVESTDDWFYGIDWQELPRQADPQVDAPGAAAVHPWLVFCDNQGVGDALMRQMAATGQPAVRVAAGDGFARLADGAYSVRSGAAADVAALLAALKEGGQWPRAGIIHLWSLDAAAAQDAAEMGVASGQVLVNVLLLVQALAQMESTAPLWLVTRNAQPAGDVRPLSMAQAPLWGFGRTLAVEHAELWAGIVDLDPDAYGSGIGARSVRDSAAPGAGGDVCA